MARLYKHIEPLSQRVYAFCRERIAELEKTISEAHYELDSMQQLQEAQGRCDGCYGLGSHRDRDQDGSGQPYPCPTCKGTGTAQQEEG